MKLNVTLGPKEPLVHKEAFSPEKSSDIKKRFSFFGFTY